MKTVLIVDDELAIADMLAVMLEDEGYHVMTAENGREALIRLAQVRPDVVLCDVMMPLLDGRELCKAMQSSADYQSIPIIMMSAASAWQAGTDCRYAAFLSKPFDLNEVLSVIEQLIGPPK
ncbi:MAG: hypothetical protein KatS3mg057_3104 [Herpetosiphonaceae bacterium]|nr:MAG: hypothetical protein KatS3mg057_3104 [Herpetosiphonaceae bacterium]